MALGCTTVYGTVRRSSLKRNLLPLDAVCWWWGCRCPNIDDVDQCGSRGLREGPSLGEKQEVPSGRV